MSSSPSPASLPDQRPDPAATHDPRAARHWLRRSGDEAPWLHGEVARRMVDRLGVIRAQPQTIVDWWARSSGSDAMLRRQYPQASVLPVEPAPVLERLAAAAPPAWWSPARWRARGPHAVDEGAGTLDGQAQLVWANMMVHWVRDPQALFARWHKVLAVDGFVMFSCLGPDTLKELRALHAEHGFGPAMRELIDMHDLGDMLVHAGFADPVMDMEQLTLTWDSAPALLHELRSLGGNTHRDRFAGLRTPRWRTRLEASLAASGPRIPMTFEIIYGHAFKPVPRARMGQDTRVALDDMRAMVRAGRSSP